jgi:hypothetical protein
VAEVPVGLGGTAVGNQYQGFFHGS